MHLQSSPSWKQFSLKQSVTVINTRIISHKARPTPKKSGGTLQLIFGSKFFDINSLFLQSSLVSRN